MGFLWMLPRLTSYRVDAIARAPVHAGKLVVGMKRERSFVRSRRIALLEHSFAEAQAVIDLLISVGFSHRHSRSTKMVTEGHRSARKEDMAPPRNGFPLEGK